MAEANYKLIESTDQLTGVQKAAILMISLGVEHASGILKELRDEEVEQITLEIANMENISSEVVNEVMQNFYRFMTDKNLILEGGLDFARNILQETKGKGEARGLLKRLENATGKDTFGLFQDNDNNQIIKFLQNEHPQIAAIILAHLKSSRAAEILSGMDDDFRTEVSYRMAKMGEISPEVVEEIEEVIRGLVTETYENEVDEIRKGTAAMANILSESDIATERAVLERLEEYDAGLAEEIKNQMFLFEDITELDDRDMQVILGVVEKGDLVLGLKGVDKALYEKVVSNMSTRAREMFEDDMEASGAVHKHQVEESQQNIVAAIKRLEKEGQISTKKADPAELLS